MTRRPTDSPTDAIEPLEQARAAYRERAWAAAFERLSEIDSTSPLGADDLERMATAAYLIGRDDAHIAALERAYQMLADVDLARATRCAFWLGLCLLFSGQSARANGWLARARTHVEGDPTLGAEAGLLLLPEIEGLLVRGDWEAAERAARRAIEIGERFGDADLKACARHLCGRALLGACDIDRGFAMLDEAMLDVTGGGPSPIMTGLVYCSVIGACQEIFAAGRAREWTDALARWCDAQPEMLAFNGTCLVHRAEILNLSGAWPDAIAEARRACARCEEANQPPAGAAFYQEAEVHRLRGEYDEAEEAYRAASQGGFEPQPGLALMRLAQGRTDVACGSIRRLLGAAEEPLQRARFLPACVEVMLAVGELDHARGASRELAEIAGRFATEALDGIALQAQASVALADGDAQTALSLARKAFHRWQHVEAPFEAARARVLAGIACDSLGDHDGAQLELDAAVAMLEPLGAAPELARIEALRAGPPKPADTHGLTPRELEVLRHVAAGKTNRAIAGELFVSEKTIDRHLSNIFNKLEVSSRTAAAAFAFEHKLV